MKLSGVFIFAAFVGVCATQTTESIRDFINSDDPLLSPNFIKNATLQHRIVFKNSTKLKILRQDRFEFLSSNLTKFLKTTFLPESHQNCIKIYQNQKSRKPTQRSRSIIDLFLMFQPQNVQKARKKTKQEDAKKLFEFKFLIMICKRIK